MYVNFPDSHINAGKHLVYYIVNFREFFFRNFSPNYYSVG